MSLYYRYRCDDHAIPNEQELTPPSFGTRCDLCEKPETHMYYFERPKQLPPFYPSIR